eukprot:CAMPEP_0184016574 /NCGR_PEP_ID=MMETSP0954-20121128/7007_1 /TAXON_ID=627963 /ORGANISM="Aplanochytrium sp, Strain PBS07" /LENGTH=98 /DNA_ID=CAMNT_0026297615 /DNA_START=345 /DNA_END=641 /DNA_ORIENTATION=-
MKSQFPKSVLGITFLDECFQVPEVISLLPIVNANTARLVLVGDPKQLPPVSKTKTKTDKSELKDTSGSIFSDPLYKRLLSHRVPITLSTQYRCHPHIA